MFPCFFPLHLFFFSYGSQIILNKLINKKGTTLFTMKSIVVVTYFSDVFIFAPDFVFKAICFIFIFDLYFVVAFVISSVFVFSCSNFSDLVCWSLLLSWVADATRLLLKHQPAVKYNYKYKYKHCNQLYIHHYLCLSPNLYLYISIVFAISRLPICSKAP